jgi:hypothetical protein
LQTADLQLCLFRYETAEKKPPAAVSMERKMAKLKHLSGVSGHFLRNTAPIGEFHRNVSGIHQPNHLAANVFAFPY